MEDKGFKVAFTDEKEMPLIFVLYVDDIFFTCANPLIYQCKRELTNEFEMKDLGLMHYFLGLEVCKSQGDFPFSRKIYCEDT